MFRFFFFAHFRVFVVVQAVNMWFIPWFDTWCQQKGVCFTWRTLAFRRVYAGHYGFHAEKVQIVAQLSFPCHIEIRALSNSTTMNCKGQSFGVAFNHPIKYSYPRLIFFLRKGRGGCHWSKTATKEIFSIVSLIYFREKLYKSAPRLRTISLKTKNINLIIETAATELKGLSITSLNT